MTGSASRLALLASVGLHVSVLGAMSLTAHSPALPKNERTERQTVTRGRANASPAEILAVELHSLGPPPSASAPLNREKQSRNFSSRAPKSRRAQPTNGTLRPADIVSRELPFLETNPEPSPPRPALGAAGPAAAVRAPDLEPSESATAPENRAAGDAHREANAGAGAARGVSSDDQVVELQRQLTVAARGCYPESARKFHLRELLHVQFCVDERGNFYNAAVENEAAAPLLRAAALNCVLPRARPLPTALAGMCFVLPVRFGTEATALWTGRAFDR